MKLLGSGKIRIRPDPNTMDLVHGIHVLPIYQPPEACTMFLSSYSYLAKIGIYLATFTEIFERI